MNFFIRPVKELTHATKQLAMGEFDIEYIPRQQDEIGQHGRSFLHMKNSIEHMMKSKQDFISNVSHEYQTPLTSIRGFAKVLKKREFTRDEQLKYIDIIERESERLSLLSKNATEVDDND